MSAFEHRDELPLSPHGDGGMPHALQHPSVERGAVVVPIGTSLEEACRVLILATLERCGGVRKHAARMLGISLKTLYNKLVAYRAQDARAAVPPATGMPPSVPRLPESH